MLLLGRVWARCYYVLLVLGLVGLVVASSEPRSGDVGLDFKEISSGIVEEGLRGEVGMGGFESGKLDSRHDDSGVVESWDIQRRAGNNETIVQAQLGRIYAITTPGLMLKHSIVTATLVFYSYDYLLTLKYEVRYIWTRPWSVGTLLFVINRYLPFVDLSICMHALKSIRTPEECLREYSILTWVNTFGIIVSQIILLLRTLAIWDRRPAMMWGLLVLFLATVTPSLIIAHFYLKTLHFVPINPLVKYGCSLESTSALLLINYVLVLLSETTIVILTFVRGIKHLRHSNSHWVRELYASGFTFYLCLLVITVVNLIYPFVASASLKSLFSDPQRALHSLLCNHVIFVICSRQRAPVDHDNGDSEDVCEISTAGSRNYGRGGHGHSGAERRDGRTGYVLSTVLDTFVTDDGVWGERYDEDRGRSTGSVMLGDANRDVKGAVDERMSRDVDVDRKEMGLGLRDEGHGDVVVKGGWEEDRREMEGV